MLACELPEVCIMMFWYMALNLAGLGDVATRSLFPVIGEIGVIGRGEGGG